MRLFFLPRDRDLIGAAIFVSLITKGQSFVSGESVKCALLPHPRATLLTKVILGCGLFHAESMNRESNPYPFAPAVGQPAGIEPALISAPQG